MEQQAEKISTESEIVISPLQTLALTVNTIGNAVDNLNKRYPLLIHDPDFRVLDRAVDSLEAQVDKLAGT